MNTKQLENGVLNIFMQSKYDLNSLSISTLSYVHLSHHHEHSAH